MAKTETVTVRILDKDYQVNCPPEERDALLKAARALDERMRAIRSSGTVIGLERMAIMAALNLVYDLDKASQSAKHSSAVTPALQRLDDKLSDILSELEQTSVF